MTNKDSNWNFRKINFKSKFTYENATNMLIFRGNFFLSRNEKKMLVEYQDREKKINISSIVRNIDRLTFKVFTLKTLYIFILSKSLIT